MVAGELTRTIAPLGLLERVHNNMGKRFTRRRRKARRLVEEVSAYPIAFVVDGVLNLDGRVEGGVVLVDDEDDFAVLAILDDEVVFDLALELATEQHMAGLRAGRGGRRVGGA